MLGHRMAAAAALAGVVLAGALVVKNNAPEEWPIVPHVCAAMDGELFSTAGNCASQPSIDRVFGGQVLVHNDATWLAVNAGNELRWWSLPGEVPHGGTSFNVPNVGDSDYDLMTFSLCDECRYGAAWYKAGTVLFELRSSGPPSVASFEYVAGANFTMGGVTFFRGGHQYLVTASGLAGSCASNAATIYRMEGASEAELVPVGCVPSGALQPAGGIYLPDDDVLYLGNANTIVYAYRVSVDGAGQVALEALGAKMRARFGKDRGLAWDRERELMVSASESAGLHVWDVADPASPVALAHYPGSWDQVSLDGELAFVAKGGVKHTEAVLSLRTPSAPAWVDPDFWLDCNVWNHPVHPCSSIQAGTLVGRRLYLHRYSRLEVAEIRDCGPPEVPIFSDGFESGDTSAWH